MNRQAAIFARGDLGFLLGGQILIRFQIPQAVFVSIAEILRRQLQLRLGSVPCQIWIYLTAVGERVVRETDGPGQVCGLSEATAVEEAADSAEHKRQHQADSKDVQYRRMGSL